MDNKMMEKIEQLIQQGKITPEQKQVLVKALEEKMDTGKDNCNVGMILCCEGEDQEIKIKLINEDLKITGDKIENQINVLQGIERISVDKSEHHVAIQTKKERSSWGVFVSKASEELIILQSPSYSNLSTKTVSGDVEAKNIDGDVTLKSVSGDLQVEDINGELVIMSVSGDIDINNAEKIKEVVSKSGDIKINNSHIKGTIKTYSGEIDLKNASIEDSDLAVFSGDIALCPHQLKGEISIKTFSGDITLNLPSDLKNDLKYIRFCSQSGNLYCSDSSGKEIEGCQHIDYNPKGSSAIKIKTTSGNVKIKLEE